VYAGATKTAKRSKVYSKREIREEGER